MPSPSVDTLTNTTRLSSINSIINRGEMLEELVGKTETLERTSLQFSRQSSLKNVAKPLQSRTLSPQRVFDEEEGGGGFNDGDSLRGLLDDEKVEEEEEREVVQSKKKKKMRSKGGDDKKSEEKIEKEEVRKSNSLGRGRGRGGKKSVGSISKDDQKEKMEDKKR